MTSTPRTRRSGMALLLIGCTWASGWLAGCATRNPPLPETQQSAPIVVKQHALPPAAEDPLLKAALGEYANDPKVSALIDAVRRYSPWPLTAGNRVKPLVDGPQTFAAIREALTGAKHYIHVETFIYGDDDLGRQFAALLAEKRRAGIEVRVLYDSIGSMDTPDEFFEQMRRNDIEVREFRPINPLENPRIWEVQNRDHRKIVVVDGLVGFTGGINIDGTYESSSSIKPGPKRGITDGWRDTHVRIDGPAVTQLETLFEENWNQAGERTEFGPRYAPPVPARGKELVTIVANDSDSDERWLYGSVLASFDHASSRLWITQAYFAPNEDLLNAMTNAAARGVDVRLIVPGFSDSNIVLQASRATYERLLHGGVHVFEHDDALLHAKTIVIDGTLSVIGSANLDMRSFLHNDEVNAVIIGREAAQRMEAIFKQDEGESRAVNLDKWQRRSWWQRTKESLIQFFGYWL